MPDEDKPRRINIRLDKSDVPSPFLYKINWGNRTVVGTLGRVWVIEDGKMTELPRPDDSIT